jgi:hypothetical protein
MFSFSITALFPLSSIPAQSLQSLFINAKVAFHGHFDPAVVLYADWASYPSYVWRAIEFKMIYV